MYRNLRDYLSQLERSGELVRVETRVSPIEEIAEIADRLAKSNGKAILFEDTNTDFPVAINIFGSDKRMALALGVDSLDKIPERINDLAGQVLSPKGGFSEKLAVLPVLSKAAGWFPKESGGRGECQQVVLTGLGARLSLLPILKCWEHDGGRFITLPLVHTVDPETGARNVGMYRMQVFDDYNAGMHWHMHKTGARHYEKYKSLGQRMPVSICLGGDPAYTYSAIAPMPEGLDEYLLAGFLRNKPVKLVKCLTNDLYVPADCDFVIEGYVDPREEKMVEGPFGDHTGFYSLEDMYPRFHVEAITYRNDAVYPATIVGVPPQEDLYIAKATEKIFLAPIRLVMQPELNDMYMPAAGTAHNLALVDISKSYPGQAAKVISSMWGAGQMMFNKYMIVTAGGTDIRDPQTILQLLAGANMEEALVRGKGVLDVLDHATATQGKGGKLALDLSETAPNEEYIWRKSWAKLKATWGITSWDDSLAEKYGILILFSPVRREANIEGFLENNKVDNARLVVLFDDSCEGLSHEELLWMGTANSDPARDANLYGTALVIDARAKFPNKGKNPARFPNVVASSAETIKLVDRRWSEYGIGDTVPSPSLRYRKLQLSDKAEI